MGCAASVPRVDTHGAEEAQPADPLVTRKASKATGGSAEVPPTGLIRAKEAEAKPAAKARDRARSRKARARRLSYVDHEEEARFQDVSRANEDAEESEDEADAAQIAAKKKRSKGTRRRRLSYVVDEDEATIKRKLKAHAASHPPAELPGLPSAASLPTQPPVQQLQQRSSQGAERQPALEGPAYSMACVSRAGREPGFKKQNQDNCLAFDRFGRDGQALVAALDGHGPEGHTVSGFIKQHLPLLLLDRLGAGVDAADALRKCFLDVDAAMAAAAIDCEFSGSTACVALLAGRQLSVAWVGDSRGVLGRRAPGGGLAAVDMTADHKPTREAEKARILAHNGRVERLVDEAGQPIGPFRVWLQYAWIPGLAMSRALGDALAHQVGVTSEPEVFSHSLAPSDEFIVLASDGVWEFVDSQEAVEIIGRAATAQDGCRQLVDEAFQRWLVEEDGVVDDITAVVVRFAHAAA